MNKQEFIWDCEEYAERTFCDIDYDGVFAAYDFMCEKWPHKAQEENLDNETLMALDMLFFILD